MMNSLRTRQSLKKTSLQQLERVEENHNTQQQEVTSQSQKLKSNCQKKSITKLPIPSRPKCTGLVYDQRMTLHKHEWFSNEQESPRRIEEAFKRCQDEGLIIRCTMVPARPISEEALALIHSPKYIRRIKQSRDFSLEELYNLSGQFDGLFMNESTWASATLATGSLKHLAQLVARGQLANGFAFLRPPGHHAMHAEACGYCIFNSIAVVAASFLRPAPQPLRVQDSEECSSRANSAHRAETKRRSSRSTERKRTSSSSNTPGRGEKNGVCLQRILIVDWDVHHGQGTQYAFYNDPRVLFISVHRYERGAFWPNLREANYDFIGDGPGRGYNVNIPLEQTGLTDSDYLAIFHQLIMPIAVEFNPELVLVSCGFDAAIGCPEGRMWLSPAVFGHFVSHLKLLANGKLVVALEGGYYVDSLAESAVHVVKSLLGDRPTPLRLCRHPCKRPEVRRIVWPETNPLLPDQVIERIHHLIDQCLPVPTPPPFRHMVLLLLPESGNSKARSAGPGQRKLIVEDRQKQETPGSENGSVWSEPLLSKLHSLFHTHYYSMDHSSNPDENPHQEVCHGAGKRPHSIDKPAQQHPLPLKRPRPTRQAPINSSSSCEQRTCFRLYSAALRLSSEIYPDSRACGCSFATLVAGRFRKPPTHVLPDWSTTVHRALTDLYSHKFSTAFAITTGMDFKHLIQCVTNLSADLINSYREFIFRTRTERAHLGPRIGLMAIPDKTESEAGVELELQTLDELAEGLLLRQSRNSSSNNTSTYDWGQAPKESSGSLDDDTAAVVGCSSKPTACRLLVVDLTGDEEPFGVKSTSVQFPTIGSIQCDLLWCSIYRGSEAEKLAECPCLLRTTSLRHVQLRSNQRIRSVHWQRLPVMDSSRRTTATTSSSSSSSSSSARRSAGRKTTGVGTHSPSVKPLKEDRRGSGGSGTIVRNMLSLLFRVILPMAYEFGPELICVQLGSQWTDSLESETHVLLTQLVHLLSSIGAPVFICYQSTQPPSNELMSGLLGQMAPLTEPMVPTTA